jgi:hypothetical protein
MEAHGVGVQDEHLFLTPNQWTNRNGEVGYPTIPKELCGSGSTRLGGPFGVGQILLQQLGTFRNWVHPLSNGDRLAALVGDGEGQLGKGAHRYKDFVNKSWREVNFEEGHEVWLNIKNLRLP